MTDKIVTYRQWELRTPPIDMELKGRFYWDIISRGAYYGASKFSRPRQSIHGPDAILLLEMYGIRFDKVSFSGKLIITYGEINGSSG